MQKEFEDFKKENEELHMAELSFEATNNNPEAANETPLPHKPDLCAEIANKEDSPRDEASSSHFSLGAPPIHQSHPHPNVLNPQESVVDRQMSMLMNNLVGLVSKQR